jgi:hypothetical protein
MVHRIFCVPAFLNSGLTDLPIVRYFIGKSNIRAALPGIGRSISSMVLAFLPEI